MGAVMQYRIVHKHGFEGPYRVQVKRSWLGWSFLTDLWDDPLEFDSYDEAAGVIKAHREADAFNDAPWVEA